MASGRVRRKGKRGPVDEVLLPLLLGLLGGLDGPEFLKGRGTQNLVRALVLLVFRVLTRVSLGEPAGFLHQEPLGAGGALGIAVLERFLGAWVGGLWGRVVILVFKAR